MSLYYDSYTQMGGPEPLSDTHEAGTEMPTSAKTVIDEPGASWALLAEQRVATAEVWSLPHFCFPHFPQVHLIGQPNLYIWSLSWKRSGRCGFSSPLCRASGPARRKVECILETNPSYLYVQ